MKLPWIELKTDNLKGVYRMLQLIVEVVSDGESKDIKSLETLVVRVLKHLHWRHEKELEKGGQIIENNPVLYDTRICMSVFDFIFSHFNDKDFDMIVYDFIEEFFLRTKLYNSEDIKHLPRSIGWVAQLKGIL